MVSLIPPEHTEPLTFLIPSQRRKPFIHLSNMFTHFLFKVAELSNGVTVMVPSRSRVGRVLRR